MNDVSDTSDAIEAAARDLSAAGHANAADMIRRLFARAQTAEAELGELKGKGLTSPRGSVLMQEPEVGESLGEILKGEHQGP
jgi:hypothetical protein